MSDESTPLKPFKYHQFGRIKIEVIPSLFCIAFIALFYYIIFINQSYWSFVDNIAAQIFHVQSVPFIMILLVTLGGIALFCIVYLFASCFRLTILQNPVLNTIPLASLVFMDVILYIVFTYTDRFNLGGIFWLAGERGDYIFFGIIIGTAVIVVLTIIGSTQALHEPLIARTGQYTGKKFHHHYTSFITILSDACVLPVLWLMAFYHPRMTAYWNTYSNIMTYYFSWSSIPLYAWLCCWIIGLATMNFNLPLKKQKNRQIRAMYMAALIGQVVGLVLLVIQVDTDASPLIGLGIYAALPFIGLSIIPVLPWIGKAISMLISHFKPRLKKPHLVLVKLGLLVLVLFPVYWVVFIQPIVVDPVAIDLPPTFKFETVGGTQIPFSGDTAYPSFELQSNVSRQYLDLTGPWRFARVGPPDPSSIAPRTARFMPSITQGQHEPGFDDSTWTTTTVPGGYEMYNPGKYNGVCWFRRDVMLPGTFENKSTLFKFNGGGAAFLDLWIDGNYVGYHEYSMNSFAFDITRWASPGNHLFAIRTDSGLEVGAVPSRDQYRIFPDFGDYLYTGALDRPFYLEATPLASIVRADVTMGSFTTTNHLNGTANIKVNVVIRCINASGFTGSISLGIYPLNFSAPAAMRSQNTWEYIVRNSPLIPIQTVPISMSGISYSVHQFDVSASNVQYWNTKHPNLYAVEVNITSNFVIVDNFVTQTGFRNFTTEDIELRLNGADIKLGGASVIFGRYPPIAFYYTPDDYFDELVLVKNASINFLRISVLDPVLYLFTDRLGLTVDEENVISWANDVNLLLGRTSGIFGQMWMETVYREKNRPSVLLWGACNEPWASSSLLQYLRWLKSLLDVHDPERILLFACASSQDWNPAYRELRVCSPNIYGGTFEGVHYAFLSEIGAVADRYANANPGKPLINLEWGYWRGEGTNQSKCLIEGMQAYMSRPFMAGCTWFSFNDGITCCGMGMYDVNMVLQAPDVLANMQSIYANFTSGNL
nr:glycoside hydrolase family 2 TIM barrel-domain containing protein [Candidatus Sigynarchaeota archaeon]